MIAQAPELGELVTQGGLFAEPRRGTGERISFRSGIARGPNRAKALARDADRDVDVSSHLNDQRETPVRLSVPLGFLELFTEHD
jgi:hypothetical protein